MMMVAEFKNEVLGWADDIGVNPKEIHIRGMNKKWASCSSKGRLTFSFELLEQSFDDRARVIVHELLHLKHPNHGKLFKSLLSRHLSKKGIKAKSV
jgi:hypothetical protein